MNGELETANAVQGAVLCYRHAFTGNTLKITATAAGRVSIYYKHRFALFIMPRPLSFTDFSLQKTKALPLPMQDRAANTVPSASVGPVSIVATEICDYGERHARPVLCNVR